MLKAKGYESQSFERKDATLFNCIDPAWVIAKKKMIAPLFSSKEVLNLHSKSIDVHTQRLLDTVRNGQPCEMSTIGQWVTTNGMKYTTDISQPSDSVST